MLVISELLPKVQELQASRQKANSTSAVLDFLGSVTLKDVLPPVPPLTPRKFLVSWFSFLFLALVSLITRTVVGRFHRMADFFNLGGNLRSRHDSSGSMELDECSAVLRKALPGSAASDHGNCFQCCGWVPRADELGHFYSFTATVRGE